MDTKDQTPIQPAFLVHEDPSATLQAQLRAVNVLQEHIVPMEQALALLVRREVIVHCLRLGRVRLAKLALSVRAQELLRVLRAQVDLSVQLVQLDVHCVRQEVIVLMIHLLLVCLAKQGLMPIQLESLLARLVKLALTAIQAQRFA